MISPSLQMVETSGQISSSSNTMLQHLVNGVGYANMSLRAGSGKHIALAHCQLGRVFVPESNFVGRRII